MFKYIVYLSTKGDLYSFDPGTDLLISRATYLMWRHVGQECPAESRPYCAAIYQEGNWGTLRLNAAYAFPGVEEWLQKNKDRAGGGSLGLHHKSHYANLLKPLSQESPRGDLYARVHEINRYLKANWPGQRPWRAEMNPNDPRAIWRELREYFVDTLLDYSPAAV